MCSQILSYHKQGQSILTLRGDISSCVGVGFTSTVTYTLKSYAEIDYIKVMRITLYGGTDVMQPLSSKNPHYKQHFNTTYMNEQCIYMALYCHSIQYMVIKLFV